MLLAGVPVVDRRPGQKNPAEQKLQAQLPAKEYWPPGQAFWVAEREPVEHQEPAEQLVHVDAPKSLNLPRGQITKLAFVEPAGQKYPAVHGPLQDELLSPLALPKRPLGHALHTPAPPELNVPAAHSTAVELVLPAGQAYPALQLPPQSEELRPVVDP